MIDRDELSRVGASFVELGLLPPGELAALHAFLGDDCPFADALREADGIHVHGRVDEVAAMPHAAIREAGGRVENERDGYVKYAFEGGINMIYSSVDVAEDDRLAVEHRRPRPHLDHLGIDLRRESPEVRAIFDSVPSRAASLGWRAVSQGSDDKAVFCCHTSVRLKWWVYPNEHDVLSRPIELALGPLEIHAETLGCDLRPIDPAHPLAEKAACGGSAAPSCGGK